jgi:hypothetical protein
MAVDALPAPTMRASGRISPFTRLPAALAALIGLCLLIWIPAGLTAPIASDQSIFVWAGRAVMAGGLPIIDAFDVKGPMAAWSYAAFQTLFGDTIAAARIGNIVLFVVAFALLARMTRSMPGAPMTVLLAGLLGFLASGTTFSATAQPDIWAGLAALIATALLALAPDRRQLAACAAAAALMAVAVGFKLTFALLGLILAAHLVLSPPATRLARLAAMLAGGTAALALMLTPYAVAGRLGEFYQMHIGFLTDAHASRAYEPGENTLLLLNGILTAWNWPWWIALRVLAVIGVVVLWRTGHRNLTILMVTGWIAMGATIIAQGKGFDYHIKPQMMFEAVAAGAALTALAANALGRWSKLLAGIAALGLLGALVDPLAEGVADLRHRIAPDRFAAPVHVFEGVDMSRDAEAIACIRAHSGPDDPIHLFSFHAILYAKTGRPSASDMGLSYPLVAGGPAWRAFAHDRLMADLARTPPKLIFVDSTDRMVLMPEGSAAHLKEVPGLAALIAQDYAPVCRAQTGVVYAQRG